MSGTSLEVDTGLTTRIISTPLPLMSQQCQGKDSGKTKGNQAFPLLLLKFKVQPSSNSQMNQNVSQLDA